MRDETTTQPDEPVFEAVWQARIHAIAVELSAAGLFGWKEWTELFGEEIRKAEAAQEPGGEDPYYVAWLNALEHMVLHRQVIAPAELERFREAWSAAFERTPHGKPIELQPGDFTIHGADGH